MATSTVAAAKLQLKTQIEAEISDGTPVYYGFPGSDLPFDWIVIGDVQRSVQAPGALGQTRRDEEYGIEVFAYSKREGDNQQAATERAVTLMSEVEDAVRGTAAKVTLASTVLSAQVVETTVSEYPHDQARNALVRIVVECKARI